MNWCNVSIQISFLIKSCITIVTFEGLLFFMNLMFLFWFHSWLKAASQLLHLNGFFHKWTMLIQMFFVGKSFVTIIKFEWLHFFMNWFNMPIQDSFLRKTCIKNITFGFFSSWTDSICLFGSASQLLHLWLDLKKQDSMLLKTEWRLVKLRVCTSLVAALWAPCVS